MKLNPLLWICIGLTAHLFRYFGRQYVGRGPLFFVEQQMTSSSTRSQISSLTLCPVGFSFAYYAFSAYCHIIKEMSAIARLITLWVWLWVCLTHIHIDFSTKKSIF